MLESEAMYARLYGAKVFSTSLGLKIDLEFLNKLRMGSSGLLRQNFLQNYQFILLHFKLQTNKAGHLQYNFNAKA